MDGPHRRDINELLVNGYFKTSRAKSPSGSTPISTNAPSFLKTVDPPRHRSRSREPSRRRRAPPPPRPTVEDEIDSLARESSASPIPSYDPPLRGIIDQNPIILEADVSAAEAARLHAAPCPKEKEDNGERRFVLVPRSDTHSPNHDDELPPTKSSRHAEKGRTSSSSKDGGMLKSEPVKEKDTGRPPIERRRSRQDLPSLQTKVPRDLPPQFRSASSFSATPRDHDETPKPPGPRTPAVESFLSPDVQRGNPKDYFGAASSSRHASQDFGPRSGTPSSDKRRSAGGSVAGSRPGTPLSEKRNSGSLENAGRSRRNTNEKLARPQQLSEDHGRRADRHPSPHYEHSRHSRTSVHSNRRYYSSSEDDISNSDSDRHHRRRHHSSLRPEDEHPRTPSRSNRSSLERPFQRPSSRHASPLPSPKVSPSQLPPTEQFVKWEPHTQSHDSRQINSRPVSPLAETEETPRASDRLNPMEASAPPRSGSRQSNAMPIPIKTAQPIAPPGSLPIPIPSRIDLHSPGDTRRTPSFPQFDDNRVSSAVPSASSWQPPSFQPPPSSNLDKPVGSYRRYSEEIERGDIVPLPSCPRTTFIRGCNDWLTLPQCPSFDICPSCFNSTIAPTEFRDHFVPAPRRSPSTEVLCDFGSSPWYRIAWLLTRKERRRDLKLFYGLANVAATIQPCLGRHEANRQWHSIIDPKTRAPIQNFDVCHSCVKSVETLLPPLRGIFVRTDTHGSSGAGRVCDLRFDSKRFIQYFDALETTADRAEDDDGPPDTRSLANLVRRLSLIDECQKDTELFDTRWHIITQLPEFTVCEECFDEVVWPELDEGKAIPAMFNKKQQLLPEASCQLYSERMRDVFSKAVDGNDYKLLASKARERKTVELAYRSNLEGLKRQMKANPQVAGKEIERITAEWRKWE